MFVDDPFLDNLLLAAAGLLLCVLLLFLVGAIRRRG